MERNHRALQECEEEDRGACSSSIVAALVGFPPSFTRSISKEKVFLGTIDVIHTYTRANTRTFVRSLAQSYRGN